MRTNSIRLLLVVAAVFAPSVSYSWGGGGANFSMEGFNERPVVLCRNFGCTEVAGMMTRAHLFNSIASIFQINERTRVHLCEADPILRSCLHTGIRYAITVGGTPGVVHIPSFTISEVMFSRDLSRVSFMSTYDIQVNGIRSFCSAAMNVIDVNERRQAMIRDNNFRCQFTSDIPSMAHTMFNIDFIDLDYGIIGAFYSMGISGSSTGGGTGYVLMRFQNAPGANVQAVAHGCAPNDRRCAEQFSLPAGQYEVIPFRPGQNPGSP